MDVQVPITGRKFYRIDDAIAMILIDCGLVIPLRVATPENPPAPAPPAKDTFFVGILGSGAPVLTLKRPSGEVIRYNGQPRDAQAAFKPLGASIPKDILDQYSYSFPQDAAAVAEQKRQALVAAEAAQRRQDGRG